MIPCMGFDSSYGSTLRPPRSVRDGRAAPEVGGSALQEAFAEGADPSATAFVLSSLPGARRPVLWVQDRASRRRNGRLYGAGLAGVDARHAILGVEVGHAREVLWAMEEGAGCAGLAAVVGEIHGAPGVLDFRATKRLALRAGASGVPVWLIRSDGPADLSAARERWRVRAAPSEPHPFDPDAPGVPLWEVELFRARGRPPGRWVARRERGAPDRLRLLPPSGGGAPGREDGAGRVAATR